MFGGSLPPSSYPLLPQIVPLQASRPQNVQLTQPTIKPPPSGQKLTNLSASEAASLGSVMAGGNDKKGRNKKDGPSHLRKAAGNVWNDRTLDEWPEGDFRVFCGDLGNEVTEELLANSFRKYQSFQKAKVVRDRRSGKSKGYGFISFEKPDDMLLALKEMNKKYVGNRPIRVMKSKWQDREINSDKNKEISAILTTAKNDSKTLRKFKRMGKPITGGKRYKEASERPAAPPRRGRGYYGPGGSSRQWIQTGKPPAGKVATAGTGHLLDNI
eukprot:GHVS01026495.1.p1 GENE.GHVS01026495.1~~GHVS01026495.1.p1  ORF type:complete len:270 (+),score=37.00 GHVS01026495.1:162-971(+)